MHNRPKTKSIEDIHPTLSPPLVAERRDILYTNQLQNSNQIQTFLKDPSAIYIYMALVRRIQSFSVSLI